LRDWLETSQARRPERYTLGFSAVLRNLSSTPKDANVRQYVVLNKKEEKTKGCVIYI
jgi:hypothetical protein